MGLLETFIFGLKPLRENGFEDMAIQRLGHGLEPIDWKTILLNQLRAEALFRPLSESEQFLLESLSI